MTVTAVDAEIINTALSLIGSDSFFSTDDVTELGAQVKSIYVRIRDARLASYSWRFCLRVKQLTEIPSTDSNFIEARPEVLQSSHVYRLPPDCLHPIGIADPFRCKYEIFGNEIHTLQQAPIYLFYKSRVEAGLFSEEFKTALAFDVASNISVPVTQDVPMMNVTALAVKRWWAAAMFQDHRQGFTSTLYPNLHELLEAETAPRR